MQKQNGANAAKAGTCDEHVPWEPTGASSTKYKSKPLKMAGASRQEITRRCGHPSYKEASEAYVTDGKEGYGSDWHDLMHFS